jgi:hypothetical protein
MINLSPDFFVLAGGTILLANQVVWVVIIPLGDQFITGLADVFTAVNGANENAGQVKSMTESGIRPVLDWILSVPSRVMEGFHVPRPSALTVRPA